jgi:uncharacterized protein (TIGR00299 family) protein
MEEMKFYLILPPQYYKQALMACKELTDNKYFCRGLVDIEKIHFHEVGAADSIADIVGAVVGLDYLGVEEIQSSSIPTGCGTIKIAHGVCSVPAPATAELLRGIPILVSEVPFELTTPTGAALLKYYVKKFGAMPTMMIQSVGVGAGSRHLEEQANILRILIGDCEQNNEETEKTRSLSAPEHQYEHLFDNLQEKKTHTHHEHKNEHKNEHEQKHPSSGSSHQPQPTTEMVWIVETNLDDVSGEVIGHCIDQLWTISPLDVWTTPIQMKKQRPGVILSVLCRREQIKKVESILFTETTTIGIRRFQVERTVLHRESCRMTTAWGEIDAKKARLPDGTEKIMPEFESVKNLAAAENISVREIMTGIAGTKIE